MYILTRLAQGLDPEYSGLPQVTADDGAIENALAVVFGVFAAVAVLVIIYAAIDFATGGGNPEKVSRARNTIIYALIGLVISLTAEGIVYFVLGRL
jgi:Type IV secretion system pilin